MDALPQVKLIDAFTTDWSVLKFYGIGMISRAFK